MDESKREDTKFFSHENWNLSNVSSPFKMTFVTFTGKDKVTKV